MSAKWPHGAWFPFLEARETAIASMRASGFSDEKILETLNLQDVEHVRWIAECPVLSKEEAPTAPTNDWTALRQAHEIWLQPYSRLITRDTDGRYTGQVLELPGCVARGASSMEACHLLEVAALGWLEHAIEQGNPIPRPLTDDERDLVAQAAQARIANGPRAPRHVPE